MGAFGQDGQALVDVRRDMLRFASLQLRDEQLAEDVVQEAMMAALSSEKSFAGRSALKTWVFAILRHKIVDAIRQRCRSVDLGAASPDDEERDQAFDAQFKASDHWMPEARPSSWGDPEAALRQEQFWAVFEACLNHLPDATARVFMMREFLELETDEVCAELKLSVSNCHVILHRARNGLRRCLGRTWFGEGAQTC